MDFRGETLWNIYKTGAIFIKWCTQKTGKELKHYSRYSAFKLFSFQGDVTGGEELLLLFWVRMKIFVFFYVMCTYMHVHIWKDTFTEYWIHLNWKIVIIWALPLTLKNSRFDEIWRLNISTGGWIGILIFWPGIGDRSLLGQSGK